MEQNLKLENFRLFFGTGEYDAYSARCSELYKDKSGVLCVELFNLKAVGSDSEPQDLVVKLPQGSDLEEENLEVLHKLIYLCCDATWTHCITPLRTPDSVTAPERLSMPHAVCVVFIGSPGSDKKNPIMAKNDSLLVKAAFEKAWGPLQQHAKWSQEIRRQARSVFIELLDGPTLLKDTIVEAVKGAAQWSREEGVLVYIHVSAHSDTQGNLDMKHLWFSSLSLPEILEYLRPPSEAPRTDPLKLQHDEITRERIVLVTDVCYGEVNSYTSKPQPLCASATPDSPDLARGIIHVSAAGCKRAGNGKFCGPFTRSWLRGLSVAQPPTVSRTLRLAAVDVRMQRQDHPSVVAVGYLPGEVLLAPESTTFNFEEITARIRSINTEPRPPRLGVKGAINRITGRIRFGGDHKNPSDIEKCNQILKENCFYVRYAGGSIVATVIVKSLRCLAKVVTLLGATTMFEQAFFDVQSAKGTLADVVDLVEALGGDWVLESLTSSREELSDTAGSDQMHFATPATPEAQPAVPVRLEAHPNPGAHSRFFPKDPTMFDPRFIQMRPWPYVTFDPIIQVNFLKDPRPRLRNCPKDPTKFDPSTKRIPKLILALHGSKFSLPANIPGPGCALSLPTGSHALDDTPRIAGLYPQPHRDPLSQFSEILICCNYWRAFVVTNDVHTFLLLLWAMPAQVPPVLRRDALDRLLSVMQHAMPIVFFGHVHWPNCVSVLRKHALWTPSKTLPSNIPGYDCVLTGDPRLLQGMRTEFVP
eukprot:TRINITY_DN5651_c0_g1_i2.p1 TRINITY_DN5651_c0_g1~~TRINITY_DN5651_c0_g1_i2.p1  ORF type:complete len:758 (-),score=70.66 TRINITY_DN5651_c0_g1_i2:320-2593(-)